MKQFELKALADYFARFKQITKAERIDDNVIRILFDRTHAVAFDLTRGQSDIFDASHLTPARRYRAPFDTALNKRLSNAAILRVTLPGNDRILCFETEQRGAYKATRTRLRLEFTGRHTNAILLDDRGVVIEALRHIDEFTSVRPVKPGLPLRPLPPYDGPRQSGTLEDPQTWLQERARLRTVERLKRLKSRYDKELQKKITRLERELAKLPDRQSLEEEAERLNRYGTLALAHLHRIRPYDTRLEVIDFDGTPLTIPLPPLPNPKRMGEHFFKQARRAAAKARNLHIEAENLQSRIAFYRMLRQNLAAAPDEGAVRLLFPPKERAKRRKTERLGCELFELDGWRLLVGRNERENTELLKNARAQDLWLHLKDRPSAHCILQNPNRRQIPRDIIEKAARICVATSVAQPGDYPVDFTFRRNVKVRHGAQVNYVDYDTIKVRKE
ncbi:MAG: DUF814 domain-containing protein [Epsilonproteobacteria bacterium]|nr:DUF814 domain-containing protein [Campylobacterota bacterium]